MATKKETLEKLIDFVSELASQNGNAWFVDKLVRKISDMDAQPITRQMLNEVHEHCIRSTARSQAQGFYNDFRIEKIKTRLVDLYVEMELCRREDDFDGYCTALCKQIEAIVTALFDENIQDAIRDRHMMALRTDNTNDNLGDHLWEFIFYKKYDYKNKIEKQCNKRNGIYEYPRWDYQFQFRSILYIHYYAAPDAKTFNRIGFDIMQRQEERIRTVRDKNSHGSIEWNYIRQGIYDSSVANKYRYYHEFSAFHSDFILKINKAL